MTGTEQPIPEIPFQERYDQQEKLGEGGFGVVYRAYDFKLRRDVAIKYLKTKTANEIDRKRFLREAEALARVKHPNVVNIYDFGNVDDQVYIVMDCLEGQSLASAIASEKQPNLDQYVRWIQSIAKALAVVHEEGLIHRDLKAQNILIDLDQEPHLLDFGLVFLTDAHSRLTKTEGTLGTPAYMSPEQATGRKIDPRADIYGLGATLYECLTFRPPFEGSTALNVLPKVIHDDPREPSHWNRRVPADLDVICMKCLEKNPNNRYQDAKSLVADLTRFLNGEAIDARPRTWLEQKWRRIQKRKLAASLAFALVFTILAGSTGFLIQLKKGYDQEQAYFDDITAKNRQLKAASEIDKTRLQEIKSQKDQLIIERDNVAEKQRAVHHNKKIAKTSLASFVLRFSRYLALIGESPQSVGFRKELDNWLVGTANYIQSPEEKKRYQNALNYHSWRGQSVAPSPIMTFEDWDAKAATWLADQRRAIIPSTK